MQTTDTGLANVPFADDAYVMDSPPMIKLRAERLAQFIRTIPSGVAVLNIGRKDWVSEELMRRLHISTMHYTLPSDFNYQILAEKRGGVIFCFEVIEHIMNPLLFLQNLKSLMDRDTLLYLSTPLRSRIFDYPHDFHFTEYHPDTLRALFNHTGLAALRHEDFYRSPVGTPGIRPILRRLLLKTQVYELKINASSAQVGERNADQHSAPK